MKRVLTPAIKQKVINKDMPNDYCLAVRLYVKMYMSRFNRHPIPAYHLKRLESYNQSRNLKYSKIFEGIVSFLYSEKFRANAANPMYRLLEDYYNLVFSYYARYNRAPTINQISAGMINTSQFITFVNNEESMFGSYWMSGEEIEKARKLVEKGGNVFRDELLESYDVLPPVQKKP